MSTEAPPTKRTKYDLASTFDVLVGKAETLQRFMLHINVFIPRSEFFRAARSSQWLSDPQKPVDLKDEDVEIFSLYMNCVYFGSKILKVESLEVDPPDTSEDITDKAGDEERLNDRVDSFERSESECTEL